MKKDIAKKAREKIKQEQKDLNVISIPTKKETSIKRFLKFIPPHREFIFDCILKKGIVGGLVGAGGASKSYLLLLISMLLASNTQYGPFRPCGFFNVLYINGEDPEDELHIRSYYQAQKINLLNSDELHEHLHIFSALGKLDYLVAFDSCSNPITTAAFDWLDKTIASFGDVQVLLLDPMSRFFGLNENDNVHGTYWIKTLEKLSQKYHLTILFTHHEPKSFTQNQNRSLRESTGRGASAIREGGRWTASMRPMTDADAQRYQVDAIDYVEFYISKANYSAQFPASIFFKKDRHNEGSLEIANLTDEKYIGISEILTEEILALSRNGIEISRNELLNRREPSEAKSIKKRLKEEIPGFCLSKDLGHAINYAIKSGMLFEDQSNGNGRTKAILRVKSNVY